jgi:hypothetical protein
MLNWCFRIEEIKTMMINTYLIEKIKIKIYLKIVLKYIFIFLK